ncbi:MAG: integrase arm-type DNA-binding domain-containing protein [Rhodomicrobium sp.]
MTKLTVAKLEKLKAPKKNEPPYDVWDGGGFGVRVSGKPGAPVRSFQVMKRINGKQVRRVIGGYRELIPDGDGGFAEFTLAMARKKAGEWIAMMKEGLDPAEEAGKARKAKADAHEARIKNSFKAALETYLKRKSKLRSIRVIERELRRECRDWMDLPLQDIDQGMVKELIRAIVDEREKPTQAHTIFALVRGFFTWCRDTGDYGLDSSPFEKPIKLQAKVLIGARNRRNRTLKDYEIAAYWRASLKLGYPFGAVFRLLLLSALRLNEVAEAQWPELNVEPGTWLIPASRMKAEDEHAVEHAVPLVPDILALFEAIPRPKDSEKGGDFIFTSTSGRRPVSGFSKAKARLDALMKADIEAQGLRFEHFVIHDVRRSCRTKFSALPMEDIVRERLLAHVQEGDRKSYDHHDYLEEKAKGLRLWHTKLRRIVERKSADVIPFAAA